LKVEYYNGKLEEGLKLKTLEILAHRDIENLDLFVAQECSNNRIPS